LHELRINEEYQNVVDNSSKVLNGTNLPYQASAPTQFEKRANPLEASYFTGVS